MKRINKAVARRLYNSNENIIIAPCKFMPNVCAPNSMAMNWLKSEFDEILDQGESDFDKRVNAFTYYNCNYETGCYPAYYVEV